MSIQIQANARAHDWDSMHARDIAERIDLIRALAALPQRELMQVLTRMKPIVAVRIVAMINRRLGNAEI